MLYLDKLARRGILASIQPSGRIRLNPDYLITDEIRTMMRDHREDVLSEILSNATPHAGGDEIFSSRKIIWVATDLNWFDGTDPRIGYETPENPYTGVVPEIIYRQLDPQYYAWLDHTVKKALRAYNSGRLGKDTYHQMRWNMNPIDDLAYELFGEGVCEKAKRSFSPGLYVRPSEKTYTAYRKAVEEARCNHQRR
jgi:hypothetical protein